VKAAATALGDAAKLDTPMKARALLDLAKVQALMGDQPSAVAALEQCLAVDDSAITPEAARFAGDLTYNQGAYDKAIGYYNTVVGRYQSSPHFASAVVGLLWSQFADARYDQLHRTFENAIDALPVSDRRRITSRGRPIKSRASTTRPSSSLQRLLVEAAACPSRRRCSTSSRVASTSLNALTRWTSRSGH